MFNTNESKVVIIAFIYIFFVKESTVTNTKKYREEDVNINVEFYTFKINNV